MKQVYDGISRQVGVSVHRDEVRTLSRQLELDEVTVEHIDLISDFHFLRRCFRVECARPIARFFDAIRKGQDQHEATQEHLLSLPLHSLKEIASSIPVFAQAVRLAAGKGLSSLGAALVAMERQEAREELEATIEESVARALYALEDTVRCMRMLERRVDE